MNKKVTTFSIVLVLELAVYGAKGDGGGNGGALATALAVAAGGMHTCALTSSGGVKCWGSNKSPGGFNELNNSGQLGNGAYSNSKIPVNVTGLSSGVTMVSAGGMHTCALTAVGGVKCWGENGYGQLGNGTKSNSNIPVNVTGLSSGVTMVSSGYVHTCALTSAGGVKCWGSGGPLGKGTESMSKIPIDVTGLSSGVTMISAGSDHTCVLTSSGGVKCWGAGGLLGNGTNSKSNIPVNVTGLSSGVTMISAGGDHTCALTSSGSVKCWGSSNMFGQLGNGTNSNNNIPVNVTGLSSGVTMISTGGDHTCALTSSGSVKCWGNGINGELGNASNSMSNLPVNVSVLSSGISRISVGISHACVLTTSSHGIKCWGSNDVGQLGNGTNSNSNIPVSVSGFVP